MDVDVLARHARLVYKLDGIPEVRPYLGARHVEDVDPQLVVQRHVIARLGLRAAER